MLNKGDLEISLQASHSGHSATYLITVVCAAQAMAQLGAFTFAALVKPIQAEWGFSLDEAGVLLGIIYGAYAVTVPIVLPLTDVLNPKRIYMMAVILTTISHLGMALAADGFWTGFAYRFLAGVGWGGTYMVGLKILADLVEGSKQSRAVAFHAATIGAGGALSFALAGLAPAPFNWQQVFLISALGSAIACIIMATLVPTPPPNQNPPSLKESFNFLPIIRHRSVMAYSIGYCVHTWEMFTLRSWVVTFLVFTAALEGGTPALLIPTIVAMLMEVCGTITSVLGNEAAIRIGRRRWILLVMTVSLSIACILGFSSGLGYGAAAALCLIYNAIIYADSSVLTAGTVGSAPEGKRGTALAIHAMMGYGGGFIGPVVLGVLLEQLGGETIANWGFSFAHVAVVVAIGLTVSLLLKPAPLPGDQPNKG